MKKILCPAVFVLFAAISVFTQEKIIQPTEFEAVSKKSALLLSGKARRMIRTVQSTVEVIPESNAPEEAKKSLQPSVISIKSMTEIHPSAGSHSVYEFNSSSINTKKEVIRTGDKIYTREGDGEWTTTTPQVVSKADGTTKRLDTQIEYKSVGSEKVGDQNTNIYAKTEKSKFINATSNQEGVSSTTTKYWYAEDGRLVKRETKREIRNGRMLSKFSSIIVFELDPNIKIEAPKVKSNSPD